MAETPDLPIRDNPKEQRFEIDLGDGTQLPSTACGQG
jgi:hypothetical protein